MNKQKGIVWALLALWAVQAQAVEYTVLTPEVTEPVKIGSAVVADAPVESAAVPSLPQPERVNPFAVDAQQPSAWPLAGRAVRLDFGSERYRVEFDAENKMQLVSERGAKAAAHATQEQLAPAVYLLSWTADGLARVQVWDMAAAVVYERASDGIRMQARKGIVNVLPAPQEAAAAARQSVFKR